DYHHADDWLWHSVAPQAQLDTLSSLIVALRRAYGIDQLLMHREVTRGGEETVCPGDHIAGQVEALRARLSMRGP
ncbi:MAG: hypothetical protein KDK70_04080, partial [Myxococcales bacterium]|nr:hypothetical protein [Myxococcales bacterium]